LPFGSVASAEIVFHSTRFWHTVIERYGMQNAPKSNDRQDNRIRSPRLCNETAVSSICFDVAKSRGEALNLGLPRLRVRCPSNRKRPELTCVDEAVWNGVSLTHLYFWSTDFARYAQQPRNCTEAKFCFISREVLRTFLQDHTSNRS